MSRLLLAATIGVILGGLIRPEFDQAYYDWRYADIADAQPTSLSACDLAGLAPTDENLEACFGPMI